MSISAIQSNSVSQIPELQRAQAPAAAPDEGAGQKRIVPEERAFDRYIPENKAETTICNTDQVDQELEQLKQRQEQLEEQLRSASPEQADAIQQQLDQVERELAQKDNDTYRRQQAVFS